MAIARIASGAHSADAGAGATITLSHTVASGSDTLMVAGGGFQTGAPMASFTFNGDAGTVDKSQQDASSADQQVCIASLVNPDVATGNAVFTKTGNGNQMDIAVANYTGAKQTGQPDSTGSANTASGSGLSYSVTTVAADCWIMTMITNTVGGAITGTSNYTGVGIPRNGVEFGDSNASVGAGGSKTVSFTGGSGRWWAASAAYAPSVAAGPAGVKTYNGVTAANTKTINGVAIASVKTKNGVA